MNLRRILTIFRKDARDAIRDGRVLVAILVPLAIGVFYNVVSPDESQAATTATVAHTPAASTLSDPLRAAAGDAADLTFEEASPKDVRQIVKSEEAEVGIIAPEGFRGAVAQGESPRLTLVLPEPAGPDGEYVASLLGPTLRSLAGQPAPASVQTEAVQVEEGGGSVLAQLGPRTYLVLAAAIMLIGFVCMLAVPVILAEEKEKKTLDALAMVASYGEVIAAKALVGILYVAVSIILLLGITGLAPTNTLVFAAAVALLSVALIGFGLLMGGLFRNANQLNTWSGFLLIPVIAPAFMVGFPLPRVVEVILTLLPTSQAMRLAVNATSNDTIFSNPAISFVVIAAWGIAGYAVLLWSLRRQERA